MNRRAPRLAGAASLPADPPSCRARQAAAGNWRRSTKVRVSDQDQRETAPGREHQAPTSPLILHLGGFEQDAGEWKPVVWFTSLVRATTRSASSSTRRRKWREGNTFGASRVTERARLSVSGTSPSVRDTTSGSSERWTRPRARR